MRSWILVGTSLAGLASIGAPVASGQTIQQAMSSAYVQSTQLEQQRAAQRAVDEQVPQALSNWRPTVTASGSVTREYNTYNQTFNGSNANTSKSVGIQITQNIYRGGRTEAQTNQATNTVKSGQSQLKATEQSVLLAAAQSYLDVVRDQSEVELTANNEAVLKRQLEAEQDRFRVGEVTRTDVALAEASYQQARAQHTSAIGTLQSDWAAFQRVVGQAPGTLAQPEFKYRLPDALEDAVAEAEVNNPAVIAAEYTERASRDAVDLAEGARLPTVSVVGTLSRIYPGPNNTNISLGSVDHVDTGSVAAQMTWPLYTGGLVSSQVRQAKQTANQYLIAIEDAKRVARQNAISAWNQLKASRANIEALTAQVKAAEIGAEGTRQQALVGTSTVLDSLTAEQQLLEAQVNLVIAQHDALLNSFALLASVGRMNARELGLAVAVYDPQKNQDEVGDKWFGTRIQ